MTGAELSPRPEAAPEPPAVDERWLAVYIFYTGNARAMLTGCVRPLISGLLDDGLITGYFFLNYWLEGPHVRVRFKVESAKDQALVRARAETEIGAFLRRRPSLYEVKSDFYVGLYNTLFDLEYDDRTRERFTGEDGRMRIRPNNSFSWESYEPEYDKYGGPVGVELAERHFRQSTDIVLDAVSTMNLHLRTVLLGYAAQLMMVMSSVFTRPGDNEGLVQFLAGYRDFWYSAFETTEFVTGNDYERNIDAMAESVADRFRLVRDAIWSGEGSRLPGSLGEWADHCAELREEMAELAEGGKIVFRSRRTGQWKVKTDPGEVFFRLLPSYLHMTNNRLSVTLSDEAYLAHILVTVLAEDCGMAVPALPSRADAER